MKLSNIANVIDIEHDAGRLIEIGLTTVDINARQILKTYSIPIKVDFEVSPEITALTGWTTHRLNKRGISRLNALIRLYNYGCSNRLLVTDSNDEIQALEGMLRTPLNSFSGSRLNLSILFRLKTKIDYNIGLEGMLKYFDMEFEGKLHSGADDSRNIARLFLRLY